MPGSGRAVSAEHIYRCDGPGCDTWVQSSQPPPRGQFLHVLADEETHTLELDFCGWECAMRYGAGQPIPEVIPFGGDGNGGGGGFGGDGSSGG